MRAWLSLYLCLGVWERGGCQMNTIRLYLPKTYLLPGSLRKTLFPNCLKNCVNRLHSAQCTCVCICYIDIKQKWKWKNPQISWKCYFWFSFRLSCRIQFYFWIFEFFKFSLYNFSPVKIWRLCKLLSMKSVVVGFYFYLRVSFCLNFIYC